MKICPSCESPRVAAVGDTEVMFEIDEYGSPTLIIEVLHVFPPDEYSYQCLDCGWEGKELNERTFHGKQQES